MQWETDIFVSPLTERQHRLPQYPPPLSPLDGLPYGVSDDHLLAAQLAYLVPWKLWEHVFWFHTGCGNKALLFLIGKTESSPSGSTTYYAESNSRDFGRRIYHDA